jgi:hypothetical protein
LAAQTTLEFDVQVIVDGAPSAELEELRDLVATFDRSFSDRVQVIAMEGSGSPTPIAFGMAHAKAAYVATVYPDDVVFAHWAETFKANAARADGRAMASLVAVQVVETAICGGERIVSTIDRPRFPEPGGFELMEHLASPPASLRGWAVPRAMARRVLGPGISAAAEAWSLRLAAALTCGVLETGEVTYLRRTAQPEGPSPADVVDWERERNRALETLDRCGLTLGPGVLQSLGRSAGHGSVRRLEEELGLLRAELQRAEEARRHQAAAEDAAHEQVAELLASASWRASAPLRALGGAVRRLRWRLGATRSG